MNCDSLALDDHWFNLLGAGYTFLAVKRYQSEIRGEEDFSILEEMKWAFMTPSEE